MQQCGRLGTPCQPGGIVLCGWCWYLWPYSFQPAPILVVPARLLQPYSLKEAIWGQRYKELTTGLEAASAQLSGESSLRQKLRIGYALQPTIQGRECADLCSDIESDTVDGNLAESMCEDYSRSDNVRSRSQRPPACWRCPSPKPSGPPASIRRAGPSGHQAMPPVHRRAQNLRHHRAFLPRLR